MKRQCFTEEQIIAVLPEHEGGSPTAIGKEIGYLHNPTIGHHLDFIGGHRSVTPDWHLR